jgi:hypothetical protein
VQLLHKLATGSFAAEGGAQPASGGVRGTGSADGDRDPRAEGRICGGKYGIRCSS